LPTLVLNESTYVCGDTGGAPVEPIGGQAVKQLGLNLPEITDLIREAFLIKKPTGAGYFRLKTRSALQGQDGKPLGALCFLRQTVRQELGHAFEEHLSLHTFTVQDGASPKDLSSQACADFIRELADAPRIREPPFDASLEHDLMRLEGELARQLRQATDSEIQAQVRHVVWPIAAIILI
jgi:hypothetical protein